MNTEDIRLFLEVANLNSAVKASNELEYEQSTVSKRIKKIEQELGQTLFIRSNKGVDLTKAGIVFIMKQRR